MASYEKRKKELEDVLKLAGKDMPAEEPVLTKAVEEYIKAREEVLTDLLRLAADISENTVATAWFDKLTKGQEASKNTLGNALRSVTTPTPAALMFQQTAMNYENTFWKTLEALDIGVRRNELTMMRKDMLSYHKELQVNWEAINSENRPLLEDSRKAIKEIVDSVDKYIGQTDPYYVQVRNAAGDLNTAAKDLLKSVEDKVRDNAGEKKGDFLIALAKAYIQKQEGKAKDTIKSLQQILDYFSAMKAEYEQRIRFYRDRVIAEARVLSAVPQKRRVTDEFLQKSGVEVVKQQYLELNSAIERWSNDLPTNGLKDDAKEFGKVLAAGLFGQVAEMQKAFDAFVTQHKGHLLGELASDAEKELVDDRYAEDFVSALAGRGLDAKFRDWNADGRRLLELDLEDAFRGIEDRLRDEPDELRREIRAYLEGFKDELKRNIKEWIEKVQKSSDEVLATYGLQKVRMDFDRKPLLDVVRGR
jgi:hypothetical protein